MKKVLLIIIASIFSFSAANAAEVSFGISLNQGGFAGEGKERNYGYAGSLEKTTIEYGAFVEDFTSVFAEIGNGTVGIGVNYVPTGISTPQNINTQVQGGKSSADTLVSADFEDWTTMYVIAKLPILGMYVKGGMATVDINVKESGDVGEYQNTDTDGYMVGIGIERELANGVGIRAEITGYEFDDVNANNGSAAGTADANVIDITDMYGAVGTISLVKTF